MAQKLDLGPKLQPSALHSLDHSTFHGTSDPPHPGTRNEKGDVGTFDSELRNLSQDDYPDGGLRAWLVVLGAACTSFSTGGYVNS